MKRLPTLLVLGSAAACVAVGLLPAAASATTPKRPVRASLKADVHAGADAESSWVVDHHHHGYGTPFTATHSKPGMLGGYTDYTVNVSKGNTVVGIATPGVGYCVVATNPKATVPGHAYHYASTGGGVRAGRHSRSGACAAPKRATQKNIRAALKTDLRYAAKAEKSYAARYHGSFGAPFTATATVVGQLGAFSDFTVNASKGNTIVGTVRAGVGYCVVATNPKATVSGHAYHYASTGGGVRAGRYSRSGACAAPKRATQKNIRAALKTDLRYAAKAEKSYAARYHGSFGAPFTATATVVGQLGAFSDFTVNASKGNTIVGTVRAGVGYCVVATNPKATVSGHAYHYDSVTGSTAAGRYSSTGACISPVQSRLRAAMKADITRADATFQAAVESSNPVDNPPAGVDTHLVATHAKPALITAQGHYAITAGVGDTVRVTVAPKVYCIVVSNPTATVSGHAYHLDAQTGKIVTGARC